MTDTLAIEEEKTFTRASNHQSLWCWAVLIALLGALGGAWAGLVFIWHVYDKDGLAFDTAESAAGSLIAGYIGVFILGGVAFLGGGLGGLLWCKLRSIPKATGTMSREEARAEAGYRMTRTAVSMTLSTGLFVVIQGLSEWGGATSIVLWTMARQSALQFVAAAFAVGKGLILGMGGIAAVGCYRGWRFPGTVKPSANDADESPLSAVAVRKELRTEVGKRLGGAALVLSLAGGAFLGLDFLSLWLQAPLSVAWAIPLPTRMQTVAVLFGTAKGLVIALGAAASASFWVDCEKEAGAELSPV